MIVTKERDTRAPLARAECADSIRPTSVSRVASSDHCFPIISDLFTTRCCLTIANDRCRHSSILFYIYVYTYVCVFFNFLSFIFLSLFLYDNIVSSRIFYVEMKSSRFRRILNNFLVAIMERKIMLPSSCIIS